MLRKTFWKNGNFQPSSTVESKWKKFLEWLAMMRMATLETVLATEILKRKRDSGRYRVKKSLWFGETSVSEVTGNR